MLPIEGMRFNFAPQRKPITAFSLASLTDIVLLLLIFFLLTSNFMPQFALQVTLPQVSSVPPPERAFVTVTITKEGELFLDNRAMVADSLAPALIRLQETREVVVIRADQDATIGRFATVASAAREAGMRIQMATDQSRDN